MSFVKKVPINGSWMEEASRESYLMHWFFKLTVDKIVKILPALLIIGRKTGGR